MKQLLICIASIILFAGCPSDKSKEHKHDNGTHQHDDGSIHQNHEEDTTKQEEFIVPADTLNKKEHNHDGHDHPHTH